MDFTFIYILSNIWYSVLKYIKDEQSKTNTYTHKYTFTDIHKHIKKNSYEKKNLVATDGKFKLIF